MDFPKKQQQCLIPKYLLDYLGEVNELHPDPSDLGGGDNIEAGTGIEITGDETKTISVDDTVAMKTDIPDVSDFITEDEVDTKLEDYELKADAFSGSYNDLTDKPTIPTKTSDLNNDSGFITNSVNNLTNYYDKTSIDGLVEDIDEDIALKANSADLASVATTGSYNDLLNKPTIPDISNMVTTDTDQTITGPKFFSTGPKANKIYLPYILAEQDGNAIRCQFINDSTYYPILEISANNRQVFIGDSSAELTLRSLHRPTYSGSNIALTSEIPTVNNNTITITQGGTTKGTFTLNQSSDSTIALDAGGSSYSAGTGIKIKNDVISVNTTTVAMKSDIPSLTNYVTTDTNQNITGTKTFVGEKRIKFKLGSSEANPAGFTCYDYSNAERANLQFGTRTVSGNSDYYLTLGNYSYNANKVKVGFRLQDSSNSSYNFIMPTGTYNEFSSAGYTTSYNNYIPCSFTNGTTVVNANSYGLVNLSSLIPTVVDTVADGNMNAVTSNAVYDIVGDIETLLAAL